MKALFWRVGIVFFAGCGWTVPQVAHAQCHLRFSTVLMCQDPHAAVIAFQKFGANAGAMNLSYNKEIIHESLCNLMSEDTKKPLKIKKLETGKIATESGWVSVTRVTMPANGMIYSGYIASQYLRGECEKYDSSNPDKPEGPRSPYLPSEVHYSTPSDDSPQK